MWNWVIHRFHTRFTHNLLGIQRCVEIIPCILFWILYCVLIWKIKTAIITGECFKFRVLIIFLNFVIMVCIQDYYHAQFFLENVSFSLVPTFKKTDWFQFKHLYVILLNRRFINDVKLEKERMSLTTIYFYTPIFSAWSRICVCIFWCVIH